MEIHPDAKENYRKRIEHEYNMMQADKMAYVGVCAKCGSVSMVFKYGIFKSMFCESGVRKAKKCTKCGFEILTTMV